MTEVRTTSKFPPMVQRHLPEIVELVRIHGVERLGVFGSAMTDHYNPLTSDVDFLVSFKQASRQAGQAGERVPGISTESGVAG
jgi:predicted nucleotidyltransferase